MYDKNLAERVNKKKCEEDIFPQKFRVREKERGRVELFHLKFLLFYYIALKNSREHLTQPFLFSLFKRIMVFVDRQLFRRSNRPSDRPTAPEAEEKKTRRTENCIEEAATAIPSCQWLLVSCRQN